MTAPLLTAEVNEDAREGVPRPSLRAEIGETFLVPARTSPRAGLWIAGHSALQVPFATLGTARRYVVSLPGGDATAVCVGRPERFRVLLERALQGKAQLRETRPRRPLWSPARCWPGGAALVAVEIHPLLARRFHAAGWLICPELVRWRGSLAQMPPVPPSRSLASDLQRVKRAGYELQEAVGTRRDWEQFRTQMVIPYARHRFTEEASIPSGALLRALKRRGKLLFLTRQGQRLGAICVVCTGDEVWLSVLGVSDGEIALMREGVVAGLYALTIDWAKARGLRHLDAGRSSAFQREGLARFKRKWGISPVREPLSHLIALRVDTTSQVMRLALEREPFWIDSPGGRLESYPATRL